MKFIQENFLQIKKYSGKYFRKPKYSSTQTWNTIKNEKIPLIEIITETSTTDHEKTDSIKNNLKTIKKRKFRENGEITKKNKVEELWRENLKEEQLKKEPLGESSSKKSSKRSINSKPPPKNPIKIEFPVILGNKRRRNGKPTTQPPSNKTMICDSNLLNDENIIKNLKQETKTPIKNNFNYLFINENDKISEKPKASIKNNYILNLHELEEDIKKTMQFKNFNDEFTPTEIVLYKPINGKKLKNKSTDISNKIIEIDKETIQEYNLPGGEELVEIENVENVQQLSHLETEEQFAKIKNNILDYLRMLDDEGKGEKPDKKKNLKKNRNKSNLEKIQEFNEEFQFQNLYNFMFSS